jgi:uncharacterized damage-inducible protein DinB
MVPIYFPYSCHIIPISPSYHPHITPISTPCHIHISGRVPAYQVHMIPRGRPYQDCIQNVFFGKPFTPADIGLSLTGVSFAVSLKKYNMEAIQTQRDTATTFLTRDAILKHWQGHRQLTRRTIEAFPEDKLFSFSIGGMRSFADLAREMMGLAGTGIRGILTDNWEHTPELDYTANPSPIQTKEQLLAIWDMVTGEINTIWAELPDERFTEVMTSFGQWPGVVTGLIQYWVDNEIHHRAQGYVYLRALGIEPPPFWDRF